MLKSDKSDFCYHKKVSTNPIKVIDRLIGFQERIGDFIANGPGDGLAGYVRDGYRTRCNQAANVPSWLLALSPIAKQTLSNFCQPYYDAQGVDGFESVAPFSGGQCPVQYNVRVETRVFSQAQQQYIWQLGNTFQFNGPFNFEAGTPPGGTCQPGDIGPQSWLLVSPNEATPRSLFTGCADVSPGFRFFSIARVDGLPDSCGDPPPEIVPGPNPPADPGPLPGPEPFDDPFGGPIPSLPLPPFPGPFADYPIDSPDEPVPVDPDTVPASGGDGLPGVGDAIGDEAGEITGGEDGEEVDFGPPPDGRVWIGAFIQAAVDSRLGNIPGTGPTATVYPFVIGNCALRYGDFFGTSNRIQSRQTLIARPSSALVVDGVFVQAQPGVTLSVRGVSAPTCPENPCGDPNDG